MGSFKKVLSTVTDAVGLTDTASLDAQQKQYEEQQKAINAQAALDANNTAADTTQADSGGAAQQSASDITAAQKRRRAGSVSTALGL